MFQTTIPLSSNPPLSLPNTRTPSRLSPLFAAAALALSAFLAPTASAAVVKAAAPSLTIQAKSCLIGAAPEDRSVTVTALALLGTTGDKVTMRFTVQARQGKTRWRSLLFKDPTSTKKWETTEASGAGLKLTKTIPELDEGYEYRVVVESRSIDAAGKVVTKTARKYVPCKQPLFTPTLVLTSAKMVDGKDAPVKSEGPVFVYTVKNIGRLPAESFVLTAADGVTREQLFQVGAGPLKGNASTTGVSTGPTCTGQFYVTVQLKGADPSTLTPDQAKMVNCAVTPTATGTKAAHRR